MKKVLRTLSMMLCLAMLVTAVPEASMLIPAWSAAADEAQVVNEQPQAEPENASAEAPKEDTANEATEVPISDATEDVVTPEPEITPEPEPTATALPEAQPTDEVPQADEINYDKDASFSSAFESGYAEIKSDTAIYEDSADDAETFAVLDTGVVFAIKRDVSAGHDRILIAFNDGTDALATGWADADHVRPMNPETETADYTRDAVGDEDVLFYNDKYPLLPVTCVYADVAENKIAVVTEDDAVTEANRVKRPDEMTIKSNRAAIGAGMSATLTVAATAGHSMEDYRLISSCDDIIINQPQNSGKTATVTANAKVKTATTATIQLIAQSDEALLDSVEIEVLPAPTAADIVVEKEIRVGYKGSYQLNPQCADGTLCDSFTYMVATKDRDYVSVSQTGFVTAKNLIIDSRKYVTVYITPNNNTEARAECRVYILDAPTSVTASRTKVSAGVGDTIDLVQACSLGYAPGADEGYSGQLTFKSSKTSVARVSSTGVVTAVKAGTAKITVSLNNNTSAKKVITVQVLKAAKSATLKLTNNPIGSLMKGILSITFPKNSYSNYSVTAQPQNVLDFSFSGDNLVGYKAQNVTEPVDVTVTVAADNGAWSETAVIRVLPGPEEISVKKNNILISYGERGVKVEGICTDADTQCDFSYSSNNTSLILVDENTGELMVKKENISSAEGAKITVRSTNSDAKTTCDVTVVPQPKQILLSSTSANIGKGDTVNLLDGIVSVAPVGSHASYTFKSSNTKVAKVSADGLITGVGSGTAKITIKTHLVSVPYATYTVNVSNAMTASKKPTLTFSTPANGELGSGMSGQLKITFPKGYYCLYDLYVNDNLISFDMSTLKSSYSSKTKVRYDTVSFTVGNIDETTTALIRLVPKADTELEATLNLELLPAPAQISVSKEELTIGEGQTGAKVVGVYPEGSACDFVYSVLSGSSVTVDANTGVLTTRAPGDSTVRVAAKNSTAYADCVVHVCKAPESIAFSSAKLSIGIGDTLNLIDSGMLTCKPEGSAAGFTFKSGNSKYVTVSADGTINGIRKGTVTIKVTSHNKKTASIKVKVCSKPKSVAFTQSEYTTGVGMSISPSVKFNSSSSYSICSYDVSDRDVATIDPNTGAIVGKSADSTTTITVTTQNGKSDTATLTVLATPDEISVKNSRMVIGLNQTGSKVVGVYPDGTACDFTYKVVEGKTVSVNEKTGEITPIVTGISTVRVYSCNSDAYVDCIVDVRPNPDKISFKQKTLMIGIGDTLNLVDQGLLTCTPADSATGYTFKSGNSKLVTVTSDGTIKGIKTGTATISATSSTVTSLLKADRTTSIKVTVYKQAKSVAFAQSQYTLGEGMKLQTGVKFSKGYYALCDYEVADENIATVDENGVITAVAEGQTTLTVKTQKATNTAIISVLKAPTYVGFKEERYEVMGAKKLDLNTIIDYDEDSMADFSFSFVGNGANYATIDDKGVLTANARGTVYVQVTATNGDKSIKSQTCAIVCDNPPVDISYNTADTVTIAKGDTVKIPEPNARDAAGNLVGATYTYKSSNTKYLKIVNGCYMQGVRSGKAKITVTSHNGKTTTLTVLVSTKAISSVKFDRSTVGNEATLYTNGTSYVDKLSLQVTLAGANLTYASLNASSTDTDVVEITDCSQILADTDGVTYRIDIIARGAGTAQIVAKNGSKTDTLPIRVYTLCDGFSFDINEKDLGEGLTYQLTPVFDPAGSSAKLSYASDNVKRVTVDENGLIKAVAPGTARVTATSQQGLTAYVDVTVLEAPISISLNASAVNLLLGESVTIKPTLVFSAGSSGKRSETISYTSSCSTVAEIDEDGTITALKQGESTITATTTNGLSVKCQVTVLPQGSDAEVGFAWDSVSIVKQDCAVIPLVLNKAALDNGYTITSSDETALKVEGESIKALKVAKGVELTLSVNSNDGTKPLESYTCSVDVIDHADVSFSETTVTMTISANTRPREVSKELVLTVKPANLIGTNYIEVKDVEGTGIAEYCAEDSLVYSLGVAGTADIICHTYNRDATCEVIVDDKVVYRALVISEYNQQASNALKFAKNNVTDICTALKKSTVDGQAYSVNTLKNPTKTAIASAIANGFSDADDNDVTLIYIVSHGYNKAAQGGYHFGISAGSGYSTSNPNSYVKGSELVTWLKQIKGNVILVLDSCTSGAFTTQNSSALKAAGNIAVITAQTADKKGFYYVAKADLSKANTSGDISKNTTEMLTYAFSKGLGYDQQQGSCGLLADSNTDGLVTVAEGFYYANKEGESKAQSTKRYVDSKSWSGKYYGDLSNITYLIPESMENLVIAGR